MTRTGSDEQVVSREDLKTVYEDWYEAFPDGKIVETGAVAEMRELLKQLGVDPPIRV